MIASYSSPFNLGHRALENFWQGTVYVQEKIDGSQFSFGVTDGELHCRSHHQELILDNVDKMFAPAVETAKFLHQQGKLIPGATYRGVALARPKHNTLCYSRVPVGNIILFDLDMGDQHYVSPDTLKLEASVLGLECVPLLAIFESKPHLDSLTVLLENESILGGTKVEGWVGKNYSLYDQSKKVLMAKLVSEKFREVHKIAFREANPAGKDIVERLIQTYGTEARWNKAIQHLREQGSLQDAPQDIGPLMKEVAADVLRECGDEIKDELFKWAWRDISRGITKNLPTWYKQQLVGSAFDE